MVSLLSPERSSQSVSFGPKPRAKQQDPIRIPSHKHLATSRPQTTDQALASPTSNQKPEASRRAHDSKPIGPPPPTHPFHSLNNGKEQNASQTSPRQKTGNQPDRAKNERRVIRLGPGVVNDLFDSFAKPPINRLLTLRGQGRQTNW